MVQFEIEGRKNGQARVLLIDGIVRRDSALIGTGVRMQSTRFIGSLVRLEIDRPLGTRHPEFSFTYPLNYGYLPGSLASDGEPLDAYVLGITHALDSFVGRCIAVIHRLNDNEDKLIVVPDGTSFSDEDIRQATEFQEKFFKSIILRRHAT